MIWATSGSTWSAAPCASCCRSAIIGAIVLDHRRRDPELPPARPGGQHARRDAAGHHRRPGGQPGGHQGPRHQRRRLLQRELVAPVREPDRVDELDRDLPAAVHRLLAATHVRPDRRQPQAGLRDRRGHGDAGPDQLDASRCGCSCSTTARCRPPVGAAMEGVEQRFGVAELGGVRRLDHADLDRVRSTRSTTPTPVSAA